jgi:hypothetical protein
MKAFTLGALRVIGIVLAVALSFALVGLWFTGIAHGAGAQLFEVYDTTQDGLQVATDPDIGNIQANANPGGKARLIIEAHLQKVAPNCTFTVELVRDSVALNGGLNGTGHTGSVQVIGTLTTNKVGNGNAHFDFDPSGAGIASTTVYGHFDFEDPSGTCTEADGTGVGINEYGGAPNPLLATPFSWLE